MRTCIVALSMALGTTAHASFDLMLLPDQTSGRIIRFDPINQVRLGSVNPQTLSRSVVANNSSAPFAYSTSNLGTVRFNASTGERSMSSGFPYSPTSLSYDGTRLYEAPGGNWVHQYDADLNFLNSFTAASITSAMAIQPLSSARVVVMGLNSSGDFVAANFDANTLIQAGPTILLISTANFLPGSFVNSMEAIGGGRAAFTYRHSDGSHRVSLVSLDGAGGVQAVTGGHTITGYATANVNSTSVLAAHTGYFVVGTNGAGNGTYITEFGLPNASIPTTVYTLDNVTMPTGRWRAANIVAPEPGTILALGAGFLALLRKKKS